MLQDLLNQGSRWRARWPLVGLVLMFGPLFGLFGQTAGVLTNLAQVKAVPWTDPPIGVPVRVRVTVTYMDPDWRMLFVQDATGGMFVDRIAPAGDASWNLAPGEVVDLEGMAAPGIIQNNINELKLHPVGPGPLPKPWLLEGEAAFKQAADASWVRATGVITGVKTVEKKLDLDLQVDPRRSLRLIVAHGSSVDAATLRGSLVEATGVLGADMDAQGKPTGRSDIWIYDIAGIRTARILPITPIAGLKVDARLAQQPLWRVQGSVVRQSPGDYLVIQDESGSVRVNSHATGAFRPGGPVEVFGYPKGSGGDLVLNDATLIAPNIPLPAPGSWPPNALAPAVDRSLPELTKIAQIRNLSASEAARGYPVKVRGVITYADGEHVNLFVQDGSGGIFVDTNEKKLKPFPEAAQLVEITGFTGPGDFAPVIKEEHLQGLGAATLPNPQSATIEVLMTGSEDSQWMVVNGMVRSQTVVDNITHLSLATGDAILTATVPNASQQPAPRDLVDAWVEVRGVCATVFDTHRRLQGINLDVPNWNEVRIWETGAEDPFGLAVRPLNQLLEFHAASEGIHRAHVRGLVILCRADGSFYLQDGTGGSLIQAQTATNLIKVGQTLDVVGFPSIVNKWPVLQEATVRVAAEPSPLNPLVVAPEALLNPALHGTLVRFPARIIGQVTEAKDILLELQAGPWIADAMLERDPPWASLDGMATGSKVELTGVYQAHRDDNLNIQSFQLLLRSPEDVRVLARPSWWTARRVAWSAGALGLAFALVLAWVTLLRAQVNARTRELRVEIEERKRMEAQVAKTHKELLIASRGAGMAEVATNVLHNVGNVLNSVNVSASLVVDRARKSKVSELGKVIAWLDEQAAAPAAGAMGGATGVPAAQPNAGELRDFLHLLNEHLAEEQQTTMSELKSLLTNIEHIKEIVAMQQSYAKISGVTETINAVDLVEDALRMNAGALQKHKIQLLREYLEVPSITVEKHKVLQILVNLIRNAEHACADSARADRQIRLRIAPTAKGVALAVMDNGIGIPPENMTLIFSHGFTTRKGGHGFGLHGGALAARELGGSLTAHSDGPGTGATFVLELPLAPKP
jgi:signal transduction histidine kinase